MTLSDSRSTSHCSQMYYTTWINWGLLNQQTRVIVLHTFVSFWYACSLTLAIAASFLNTDSESLCPKLLYVPYVSLISEFGGKRLGSKHGQNIKLDTVAKMGQTSSNDYNNNYVQKYLKLRLDIAYIYIIKPKVLLDF